MTSRFILLFSILLLTIQSVIGQDSIQPQSTISPKAQVEVGNSATVAKITAVPALNTSLVTDEPRVSVENPAAQTHPTSLPNEKSASVAPQIPIETINSSSVVTQPEMIVSNKPSSEKPPAAQTTAKISESVVAVTNVSVPAKNSSDALNQLPSNVSTGMTQSPKPVTNNSSGVADKPAEPIAETDSSVSSLELTPAPVVNTPIITLNDTKTIPKNNQGSFPGYTICRVCSCIGTHMANPFLINCKGLNLPNIPSYDVFLDVGDSDLDNVQIDFDDNDVEVASELQASNVIDAISFNNCNMKAIDPYAFAYLPHLKSLSFSNNKLYSLPRESFYRNDDKPSDLEVLDLSRNDIKTLQKDIFESTPKLIKLDLHGNPFQCLDSGTVVALNGLRNLQYLNLADCGLETLPMTLTNPIKILDVFDIGHNRFKTLPPVLQNAWHLEKLILDGNFMSEIDAATFVGLESLEEVSISFMPNLTKVYKGTFQLLTSLEVLRMHDNRLLEIIEPFSITDHQGHGPHLLQLVDLSNNNLSTLDEELFESVQVAALNVANNPFQCTCQIHWLRTYWVAETNHTNVKCAGPLEVKGWLIGDVDFKTVPCPDGVVNLTSYSVNSSLYWTVTFLIILFGLAMVVVLVLRSKPEWRYSVLRVMTPEKATTSRGEAQNNDGYDALQEDWIEYQKTEV